MSNFDVYIGSGTSQTHDSENQRGLQQQNLFDVLYHEINCKNKLEILKDS